MFADFEFHDLVPLLKGAELTVLLCLASGLVGSVVGMALGLARTSSNRLARAVSSAYINLIRGIPLLIILFFIYFALPLMIPEATVSRVFTAIIALSIYAGAYLGEIVRGSIEALEKGQFEAADALGMSYVTKFRYVIIPQAMKVMVPPGIGFLISLIKGSSLVSVIGYVELTRAGRIVSTLNMNPILTFLIVAVMYFIICYPISSFGRWYERRLNRSDHTPATTPLPLIPLIPLTPPTPPTPQNGIAL